MFLLINLMQTVFRTNVFALFLVCSIYTCDYVAIGNVVLPFQKSIMIEQHYLFQVLNKIDLPGAEPDRVIQEIEEVGAHKAGFHLLNECVVYISLHCFLQVAGIARDFIYFLSQHKILALTLVSCYISFFVS